MYLDIDMHELFRQFDFTEKPVVQPEEEYELFLSDEYADKLYCPHRRLISHAGNGLGDCIAAINFAYHLSEKLDGSVGIVWQNFSRKRPGAKRKINELLGLLGFDFKDRVYVSEDTFKPHTKRLWWFYYGIPYKAASTQWKDNDSKKIAYQFDALSKMKWTGFPSGQDDELIEHMESLGFEMIDLSKIKDLGQWLDTLSLVEAFMGVDSGGSHMAHLVRAPTFLFYHKFGHSTLDVKMSGHRNEAFIPCKDWDEFKNKII